MPLTRFSITLVTSLLITGTNCRSEDTARALTTTEIEINSLTQKLPLPIRIRLEKAKLNEPEFRKAFKELNFPDIENTEANLHRLSAFRSSDGQLYLIDNMSMALWIWASDDWKCLFSQLRIDKTFGGAPPRLPLKYLGKGFFAFAETSPESTDKKNGPFPQAFAITYLIDSANECIAERSKSYLYDQNPPVKVYPAWLAKYQLPPVSEPSPKSATFPDL